jgi:predicted nucleotidyltransferase
MKFGSHLYGLNTPTSDVDYKGIFMPTLEQGLGMFDDTWQRVVVVG